MKVIITGSTGMVGKGVLLECLEDKRIKEILVINRHSISMEHSKLKEIIHSDFFNLAPIKDDLKGYDTCYFCLGISASGMNEKDYTRITYDLTMNFAQTLYDLNPKMTFIYVSGAGTDSSEKGRMMWARVKGRTENELQKIGFPQVYLFRPGFIQPEKGIRSRTPIYNTLYRIFSPLYPILKRVAPKYVTTTTKVGKAMIEVSIQKPDQLIFENRDMNVITTPT